MTEIYLDQLLNEIRTSHEKYKFSEHQKFEFQVENCKNTRYFNIPSYLSSIVEPIVANQMTMLLSREAWLRVFKISRAKTLAENTTEEMQRSRMIYHIERYIDMLCEAYKEGLSIIKIEESKIYVEEHTLGHLN